MANSPNPNPSQSPQSPSGYDAHSKLSRQKDLMSPAVQTPSKRPKSRKWWLYNLFSLLIGILWLAPMIVLLYFNISNHVIGAAAWCPGNSCGVISYSIWSNDTTTSLVVKRDKENRNLLGALQFAAKALEVWFVYIATSLVFLVGCTLAKQAEGIPTKYILTYLEYGDLCSLFDPSLYKAPLPSASCYGAASMNFTLNLDSIGNTAFAHAVLSRLVNSFSTLFLYPLKENPDRFSPSLVFGSLEVEARRYTSQKSKGHRMHTLYLYVFTILVVSMCIVANLMGPSAAVLMIPTLQWRGTQKIAVEQFHHLKASGPPENYDMPGCNPGQLRAQNYSCSQNHFGHDLGSMIAANAAMLNKLIDENTSTGDTFPLMNAPISFEGAIPFTFNMTLSHPNTSHSNEAITTWALNRQVLRSLSSDFEALANVVLDLENRTYDERYGSYNNSYSIVLQRQGPIIGTQGFYGFADLSTTTIDENRTISCYSGFIEASKAKCFRTGEGWNETNRIVSFNITDGENKTDSVQVRIYWSDLSTNIDVNSMDPCFRNGTTAGLAKCNYNGLFSRPVDLFPGDHSQDIFIIEVSRPRSPDPDLVFVTEYFISYNFAAYSLDATTVFPYLGVVEITDPPDPNTNNCTVFDPSWALVAWGVSPGDEIPNDGAAANLLQKSANRAMDGFIANSDVATYVQDLVNLFGAVEYTLLQAASLVPYSNTQVDPRTPLSRDMLWRSLRRQVWGWGTDSRTSVLGVVIGIIGCLIVLARTVLLIKTREREPISTELIAAALRHKYTGEFDHKDGESELARVRYQIVEEDPLGRQFRPVLGHS